MLEQTKAQLAAEGATLQAREADLGVHSVGESRSANVSVEQKLQESEVGYRALFEHVPDGIYRTSPNGRLLAVNPALVRMLGFASQDELISANISHGLYVRPEERAYWTRKLEAEGEIQNAEITLRHRGGRPVVVLDNAYAVRDAEGNVLYYEGTLTDITERKRAEEGLRSLNAELAAYDYSVSHDLKGPLGFIAMSAEFLLEECSTLPEMELKRSLQDIVVYAHRANTIIESLLLLTQPEEIEPQPLAMDQIIAVVQDGLAALIAKTGAEVILPGSWPLAFGQPALIQRVWDNYLSNGIKYGGRPPRLELGGEVQPDGQVRFWVRDNGDGVSPEDGVRLFTAFIRLQRGEAKGHGLGLYIARRIVEKLGGSVGVESNGVPGCGSLFYFSLPPAPVSEGVG
ncbi:MAG: PAS domain S-box protein [Chloroflexi bacterium]|nr:PAS domain S-box protein [Chloroflexota bacterium]